MSKAVAAHAGRDWDAASYDRISGPQHAWALEVLERLPLAGDEAVLDAGCGSGRVTAEVLERVPRARDTGGASRAILRRVSVVRVPSLAGVVVVALTLLGCGGTSDGPEGERAGGQAPQAADTPAAQLAPAAFARAARDRRTVTINVHTPFEGAIAGTELSIPYDRIDARRDELPDRSTRLAVYCKTGRMSKSAARTLARLGFRRIVELDGGMVAWSSNGRRLEGRARG